MRRFAAAALPVAIGAALQISGLTGRTLSIVAWAIVGLTLAFLMVHWAWLERRNSEVGQAKRWHQLGGELIAFVGKRQVATPRMQGGRGWVMRGKKMLRGGKQSEHRRLYEADTMLLYLELFARRVRAAVAELRKVGLVGEMEAETLAKPTDPEEIADLGRRLMEMSYKVG